MLNICLEWDKFVRLTLTYPTPDSCLTYTYSTVGSVAYTEYTLFVTPECTRGVIDPLYHSRHVRDRQYECDHGTE